MRKEEINMKFLHTSLLLLTLSFVLPAPMVWANNQSAQQEQREGQPAAQNSGIGAHWYLGAAGLLGFIWYQIWGKDLAKKYREEDKQNEKRECCFCKNDYRNKDLIALHSHKREHLRYNLPDIDMGNRAQYARQNDDMNKQRLNDLPKQAEHKVCIDCVIRIFKSAYHTEKVGVDGNDEAGTCLFHTMDAHGHGLCKRCDARGICLYCPVIFKEQDIRDAAGRRTHYDKCNCKVNLDIAWVDRNNDIHGIIDRVYKKEPETRDNLHDLWTILCHDYPQMMKELRAIRRQDVPARNAIGNKYYAEWNRI